VYGGHAAGLLRVRCTVQLKSEGPQRRPPTRAIVNDATD
jgi:hypothetical protein